MSMNNKEFLQWIHDRLQFVHGDKESYDYMHKLRSIIASTESDNTTQAAANKAAEEGGLPTLPKPELYYCDSSIPYEAYEADAVREYARRAIAADRASRQVANVCAECNGTGLLDDGEIDCWPNGEPYENGPVKCVKDCPFCDNASLLRSPRQVANKAEVEPVAFMYQDDQDLADPGTGSCVVSKARCNFYRNETPLYATPPATTGASTAQSIDTSEFRKLTMVYAQAIMHGTVPESSAAWGALVKHVDSRVSVCASTVLTDERIEKVWSELSLTGAYNMAEARALFAKAIAREVAAQAGQVAVSDFEQRAKAVWNDAMEEAALICDGVNNHDNPMTASDCADAIRELKAAAPSAAKESK